MDALYLCELCQGHMGMIDKQPRVLSCGHTFCSLCIPKFSTEGTCVCPTCNRQHYSKASVEIPVNHALVRIMWAERYSAGRSSKNAKVSSPSSEKKVTCSDPDPKSGATQFACKGNDFVLSNGEPPLQNAGECHRHGAYCTLWCKSCKEWICPECSSLSHSPIHCEVLSLNEAVDYIKLEEDCSIRNTVQLFDSNAFKYREKQSALRGMREKHRFLVKELQSLATKHQEAAAEIEKQMSLIDRRLIEGLSTLLTLLESQGLLLAAQTLQEFLASRHLAQIYQYKILDWHNPGLVDDTKEIVISKKLQKSTCAAISLVKYFMASPDNMTISSAVRELSTISAEDEPDVTEALNRIMEDPAWENVLEEVAVEGPIEVEIEGPFEGNLSSSLTSGHTQQTHGNSIVPVENSVRVENLIDLFTGEETKEEEEENRKGAATVPKQESLEQCLTSLVKNVGVDEQRVEKPKLPQEDIKWEVTFPLYPWRRVPKRPDFTKGGVGNPDCFLGIPSSPQDVGVHEVPTSPQTNGLHEVPRSPQANHFPHKRKDRVEHLSVIGINKQVIKRQRLGESSWSCKPIESNTNLPVKSEAAVTNIASLYPNLQESFSEGTSSRGSSLEHLFYYALGGFESSTESSRGEKRERS